MRPVAIIAAAFAAGFLFVAGQAAAQTATPTITQLLSLGYTLKAASSSGQTQFLYFQGKNAAGQQKIYACQLQFGSNGGFQGCLALP